MVSLFPKQCTMKVSIPMILAMLLTVGLWSQSNENQLQQLLEDDPQNVQAIVAFDADLQRATLEAAAQPDVLKQVQKIQDRSRAEFESIVKPYSQETQQILWDLTRYPNLIAKLASDGKRSESAILKDYPEVIHTRAREANKYYYNLLVQIDDLENSTKDEFESLLQRYPRRTQDAFRKLIDNPEALSALTQDKRMADGLGDLYQNDPSWTLRRFAEMNREMSESNAQSLESWRDEIGSDPEAVTEFSESAKAYAQEYGYDDEYYSEDYEDQRYYENDRPQRVIVRDYYNYSYPYWFGYPRWYRQPRWRPVPYWYDYGFYHRPNRPIVIVQMPSFYFVNWYFQRPQHHYRYARLSSCFIDYSYRYPRYRNNIYVGVERWKYRNRDIVSDQWLSDRNNRVERLREFGKLENERVSYNRTNKGREISQRDYLEKNEVQYPRIKEVAPARSAVRERESSADRTRTPEVEAPRRATGNTQPRTREEAPAREMPRRTYEQPTEETRSRPAPTENTPRRTTTPEREIRREETRPETTRREPTRTEEPRTMERKPAAETQRRSTQNQDNERPRTIEREHPAEQPRTIERPRNDNSNERQRSVEPSRQVERPRTDNSSNARQKNDASTKKEEAPRKRGNG